MISTWDYNSTILALDHLGEMAVKLRHSTTTATATATATTNIYTNTTKY